MSLRNLFKRIFGRCRCNTDNGTIVLGELKMHMSKTYNYETPHEFSMYVPRVEIRENLRTLLFTKSREIIYNSVTIVDAPQHPLAGEGSTKVIPEEKRKKEKSQRIPPAS